MLVFLVSQEKIALILANQSINQFCLSLNYSFDKKNLYVNKTKIFKRKNLDNTTLYQFCLESVPNSFSINEIKEVGLNGTVYDVSTDYGLTNS